MQPPRLVAADSNILLALADHRDDVIDAWELICSRLKPVMLIVPPTVLDEIGHKALATPKDELARLAVKALAELHSRWMLQPVELRSDQEAIVDVAAQKIRNSGLLPYSERNDALVVAETAVLECTLLVSEDSHLCGIDFGKLKTLLGQLDLSPPTIVTPREILKKFYR